MRRRARRPPQPRPRIAPSARDRVLMKMRTFRRPWLWLSFWIAGWAICIVLSLAPPPSLGAPPDSDKLGHLLAYFVLSAWAVALFRDFRTQLLAAAALIALGIGLEFAQALLTTTRSGDPRDALADALGVALGLVVGATPLATALQRVDAAALAARE